MRQSKHKIWRTRRYLCRNHTDIPKDWCASVNTCCEGAAGGHHRAPSATEGASSVIDLSKCRARWAWPVQGTAGAQGRCSSVRRASRLCASMLRFKITLCSSDSNRTEAGQGQSPVCRRWRKTCTVWGPRTKTRRPETGGAALGLNTGGIVAITSITHIRARSQGWTWIPKKKVKFSTQELVQQLKTRTLLKAHLWGTIELVQFENRKWDTTLKQTNLE